MAYIQKRGNFWRAEVSRKGYKPQYQSFDTKKDAEVWSKLVEARMTTGTYTDSKLADRTSLSDALCRYRDNIVSQKKHPYQEVRRINRWLKHPLSFRMMGNLCGADFAEYRDARRGEGRAENTIRLELSIIGHLFETARKEWSMAGLNNPLKDIKKPGGSRERERRCERSEYIRIRRHLRACRNPYAIHAFDLAIETTLRQGKLLEMQWDWIHLDTLRITFPQSAREVGTKGVPKVLPMSAKTVSVLLSLREVYIKENGEVPIKGPVLNTTNEAINCIWRRMRIKLEIKDLTWHDLRHEAISRLFEKGLSIMEVASMSGHKSMQMLKRYTHIDPETFIKKLG